MMMMMMMLLLLKLLVPLPLLLLSWPLLLLLLLLVVVAGGIHLCRRLQSQTSQVDRDRAFVLNSCRAAKIDATNDKTRPPFPVVGRRCCLRRLLCLM